MTTVSVSLEWPIGAARITPPRTLTGVVAGFMQSELVASRKRVPFRSHSERLLDRSPCSSRYRPSRFPPAPSTLRTRAKLTGDLHERGGFGDRGYRPAYLVA